ncbi:MAG: CBS domain-containing protein [Haloarculaceae archaeon]
MTVRQISRTDVVTADPDTPVPDVAATMNEERIGSVVVTEDGTPVGLVTDRDIGVGVWEHDHPAQVTAADLMTGDLVTVDVETGIYDALRVAEEANVRRLPVVDGDDLYGIVTLDDFVVLLSGEFDSVADVIQSESPPY